MTDKDYKDGYKDGFKEGYEYGKKAATPPSNPYTTIPSGNWQTQNNCRVCGMSFVDSLGRMKTMGYVCQHINCPSKVIATSISPYTSSIASTNVPDGLSYEEIYGSVVYQQNKKKEE